MLAERAGRRTWGLRSVETERGFAGHTQLMVGFDAPGADRFGRLTGLHLLQPLAIVVNDQIVCAPTIQSKIVAAAVITGGKDGFAPEQAKAFTAALRRGMTSTTAPPLRPASQVLPADITDWLPKMHQWNVSAKGNVLVVTFGDEGNRRRVEVYPDEVRWKDGDQAEAASAVQCDGLSISQGKITLGPATGPAIVLEARDGIVRFTNPSDKGSTTEAPAMTLNMKQENLRFLEELPGEHPATRPAATQPPKKPAP